MSEVKYSVVDMEVREWWCPSDDDWSSCPGPCPDGTGHTGPRTRVVKAKRFTFREDFEEWMMSEHGIGVSR